MNMWTREEIEKIISKLDEKKMPFPGYALVRHADELTLLGQGGFAYVYAAQSRRTRQPKYAIKIIGFGEQYVDSVFFRNSARVQMHLGIRGEDVVRVFDFAEIWIELDEKNEILNIWKRSELEEHRQHAARILQLQFVLMEKMEPVITHDAYGKAALVPEKLQTFDEAEVLHVAYDIGNAILRAHKRWILHRDIKLENIFYDAKRGRYKLGDFGIAKVTNNGMASTRTFTKGYGAPEVLGRMYDQYDSTADIYSFGILLYVLANDLRFPDSESYYVNLPKQYSHGYHLPRPAHGSDALCGMIDRMCRFDPDERYQSMQEVMQDLGALIFGETLQYERAHNAATAVLGICLGVLGTAAGWIEKYSWVTFVCFSLAVVLMYQFLALSDNYNIKFIKMIFSKNRYWLYISGGYLVCMLVGWELHHTDGRVFRWIMSERVIRYLYQVDLIKAGGFGIGFCMIWMIRKEILVRGGKWNGRTT